MAYADGMAAMRLEMPDRIPRTEYSAHAHWPLVRRVTGMAVDAHSGLEEQAAASAAFLKAWDYGMMWSVLTHNQVFGDKRTTMGHAVYADGGVDFHDDVRQLFADPEDVFTYDMEAAYGLHDPAVLTAEYDAHYRAMQTRFSDTVNMTGIYVTCMSGLIELLGWDTLLMAAGIDAAAFGAFTNRYCDWIAQYFRALAACESPVVMVHDDIVWTSGAFLHPDFYRTYIFPNYHKLFRPLLDAGKTILYTSDGTYTEFMEDIAAAGVHGFVMEPTTDLAFAVERFGKTHVLVGNADTRVLLLGDREAIRAEVKRCMDLGRQCPGFIMAVGNHIPANTPVDNALYYNECFEAMRRR